MWVVPGAARNEVVGIADGCMRVRVTGRAVEGKANAELVRFLADTLGVRRRDVTIVSGESARRKTVRVCGVTPGEAARRLRL